MTCSSRGGAAGCSNINLERRLQGPTAAAALVLLTAGAEALP